MKQRKADVESMSGLEAGLETYRCIQNNKVVHCAANSQFHALWNSKTIWYLNKNRYHRLLSSKQKLH